MELSILGLLFIQVIRSWATAGKLTQIPSANNQPILDQISSGSSDCSSDNLLGKFDLNKVTQFKALCNIPIPDIYQTEFLLANNVIPLLCMGLFDVSLRLCKAAKNNISRFTDIFPPEVDKFNKIFQIIRSDEFSYADVFCSDTVKKYAITEASSNITKSWWQVLNKQLSNEKSCTDLCHTNEENQIHPLCSYIIWSNGIYMNYQKDLVEAKNTFVGEDQNPYPTQELDNNAKKLDHVIGFVKNNLSLHSTETPEAPDLVPSKIPPTVKIKSSDDNDIGIENVEEIGKNAVKTLLSNTTNTDVNPVVDKIKPSKKDEKAQSKHTKTQQVPVISEYTDSKKSDVSGIILQKPALLKDQTESRADPNVNIGTISSDKPETKNKAGGNSSVITESQKTAEAKPAEAEPRTGEGLGEGDFSFEVTPDGVAMDHPIVAGKDFQSHYPDEEGEENGDGDDVEMEESNGQSSTGTSSNQTSAVKAVGGKSGLPSIEQALEGDKVYGEGEILIEDHFIEAEASHFFTYFLCMSVLTIMLYLAFHNKKKLIALAMEGRRSKGARRRPNSSHYSKLDCSLEEALVSNTTASVTHVLY